jgi:SAM-dependent methyltransferase
VYAERLRDTGTFGTLARLFALGLPVTVDETRDALAPLGVEGTAALGLIRRDGESVVPLVRVLPFGELLVVAEPTDGAMSEDVVPGLSEAGVSVANLTPRERVGTALDLGTGFGLHALLAARHAERVVATDVNPRALAVARINAELNGIENVELRQGDLLEPVAEEAFDLIVANPPFVVGPDQDYLYRDGGAGFCERVVRGASAALADGGVAVVAAGWPHDGAHPWAAPCDWLAGSGCDAAVMRLADLDPLANGWSHTYHADTAVRWSRAFAGTGLAGVCYGVVVMRRRPGGGRIARVDLIGKDIPVAGFHVLRILRNLAWLAEHGECVASARLAPAEGLELRRVERLGPSSDDARPTRLALRRGLPLTADADDELVAAIKGGGAEGNDALAARLRGLLELGLLSAPR